MDGNVIQQVFGNSLIILGLVFATFGVFAILKLDRFYSRLVITSKVETMAFITILLGAIVLTGFSFFAVKIAIIILFEMLTLPVGSHAVARSAYVNGFRANTVTPDTGTISVSSARTAVRDDIVGSNEPTVGSDGPTVGSDGPKTGSDGSAGDDGNA